MMTKKFLIAVVIGLLGWVQASAAPLPEPEGKVLLTVTGDFPNKTDAYGARFDRAMLEKMEWGSIKTHTNWHKGLHLFEGPSGAGFAKALGLDKNSNKVIRVTALNGYEAEIPLSDLFETGMIFAMKRDGTNMTVRNKGPLFAIYPYDENPKFNSDDYHIRSVWHIQQMHVH